MSFDDDDQGAIEDMKISLNPFGTGQCLST